MSSNSRVRFRSWVGPISFITKLISVMLLHSVYSPSSSVPLLTCTMCKILTAWGEKWGKQRHQLCFGAHCLVLPFRCTIPEVWLTPLRWSQDTVTHDYYLSDHEGWPWAKQSIFFLI